MKTPNRTALGAYYRSTLGVRGYKPGEPPPPVDPCDGSDWYFYFEYTHDEYTEGVGCKTVSSGTGYMCFFNGFANNCGWELIRDDIMGGWAIYDPDGGFNWFDDTDFSITVEKIDISGCSTFVYISTPTEGQPPETATCPDW